MNDNSMQTMIKDNIQVAILKALGDDKDIIPKLIACVVEEKIKVNESGERVDTTRFYGNTKEVAYIDFLCKEAIREAAKRAVQAWVNEQIPNIQAEIAKKLTLGDFVDPITICVIDSLKQSMGWDFKFKCDVGVFKKNES